MATMVEKTEEEGCVRSSLHVAERRIHSIDSRYPTELGISKPSNKPPAVNPRPDL